MAGAVPADPAIRRSLRRALETRVREPLPRWPLGTQVGDIQACLIEFPCVDRCVADLVIACYLRTEWTRIPARVVSGRRGDAPNGRGGVTYASADDDALRVTLYEWLGAVQRSICGQARPASPH